MASTWDFDLMRDASAIAAAETRSVGVPWNFSPVLDVGRNQFGRASTRRSAKIRISPPSSASPPSAAIRGTTRHRRRMPRATLKHYIGYSVPTSGHDRTPALIPE